MGFPSAVLAEVFLPTCCGTPAILPLSDTSGCMTVEAAVGLVCVLTSGHVCGSSRGEMFCPVDGVNWKIIIYKRCITYCMQV